MNLKQNLNDTIPLKDALLLMDSGAVFDIAFVTANRKTGRGGEWIEMKGCVKHTVLSKSQTDKVKAIQPVTAIRKNPCHYHNSTRNIRVLASGEIRKAHIRLITLINDMAVL